MAYYLLRHNKNHDTLDIPHVFVCCFQAPRKDTHYRVWKEKNR